MSKGKVLTMENNLYVNMTIQNEEFLTLWQNQKDKTQKRVSLPKDVFDFISQNAFEDFGIVQQAFSMEITKLVLIAKEHLEQEQLRK